MDSCEHRENPRLRPILGMDPRVTPSQAFDDHGSNSSVDISSMIELPEMVPIRVLPVVGEESVEFAGHDSGTGLPILIPIFR